jgi:uncharacterized protein
VPWSAYHQTFMTSDLRSAVLVGPNGPVATNVRWASTFATRRRGLRGSPPLTTTDALVIEPCRQVHTFGVAYPIDAVFCDGDLRVVSVQTLQPRRVSRFVRRARTCIELQAGRAATCELRPNDHLRIEEPS